jgi:hypothetical protein
MRNPYQVLREKELELEKVEREVEALRLVGPLLEVEDTASDSTTKNESEVRKDATTGLRIPKQQWP